MCPLYGGCYRLFAGRACPLTGNGCGGANSFYVGQAHVSFVPRIAATYCRARLGQTQKVGTGAPSGEFWRVIRMTRARAARQCWRHQPARRPHPPVMVAHAVGATGCALGWPVAAVSEPCWAKALRCPREECFDL